MSKVWKEIKGYNGVFVVSDCGDVYNTKTKNMLVGQITPKGYIRYGICLNGKRKQYMAHRLVAEAFIENPQNYPIINHKNEVKSDNRVENLEWCTIGYNNNYGHKSENYHNSIVKSRAKSVKQIDIKTGNVIQVFDCILKASIITGVSRRSIAQCCDNAISSAKGFKWRWNYG